MTVQSTALSLVLSSANFDSLARALNCDLHKKQLQCNQAGGSGAGPMWTPRWYVVMAAATESEAAKLIAVEDAVAEAMCLHLLRCR